MTDPLDLMKKGALAEKQERLRAECLRIDRLIQTIQINSFRLHDEDLDGLKEDQVLEAAKLLSAAAKLARKLKAELEA